MSRSWELFLRDMLEAARKVLRYTDALDDATLWKIVRTDIPELLDLLEQIERELA